MNGISADGSTVVGSFTALTYAPIPTRDNIEMAYWRRDVGLQWIDRDPTTPDSPFYEFAVGAQGASSDGSVIAGYYNRAQLWEEGEGLTYIGFRGGRPFWVEDISDDGSVVVGRTDPGTEVAPLYWTESAGHVWLAPSDPNAQTVRGEANAVSAHGEYMTGWISYDIGTSGDRVSRTAYRWSPTEETLLMSTLPGVENRTSEGNAMTPDGSIIVGGSGGSAFLWDIEGASVLTLDDPTGLSLQSNALDVTDDGSTVVGWSSEGAFIWDESNGMRLVYDLLVAEYGLDLAGWTLQDVQGISADGTVLTGNGINPDGIQEGWVAVIPEPSTGFLVGLGLMALGRRRSTASA